MAEVSRRIQELDGSEIAQYLSVSKLNTGIGGGLNEFSKQEVLHKVSAIERTSAHPLDLSMYWMRTW